MTITIHRDLHQGSEEWLNARLGLLTASEMKLIVTPTLKVANNDKTRQHLFELLAQRITRYVEPRYISDDMLRGIEDEIEARELYEEFHSEGQTVEQVGFITSDKWGFTIGYSPDALVGVDGAMEAKSRRMKYQVETIIVHAETGEVPTDYILQLQTGLLVSERKWIDLVSFSGGLPLAVMRVYPDEKMQEAIVTAASEFETTLLQKMETYNKATAGMVRTERKERMEIL